MRADRTASIAGEKLSVRYCRADGFILGIDNGLIRLHRHLMAVAKGGLPLVDDVALDAIVDSGQFGRTHVINVMADDPADYHFVTYGQRVGLENGASYEGMRLRDTRTRVMAELAYSDYRRVKSERVFDLALLDGFFSGRARRYRRLIYPLVGDGSEVTHLLVSVTKNLDDVAPGAFDDVGARCLVAENPLKTVRWRKVPFDQNLIGT